MSRHARTQNGPSTDDLVVVHGEGVRVDRAHVDVPLAEVKHRFGGVDPWAVLAGLATAIGSLVVLSSLLAAAGVAGAGQLGEQTLSIAGLVAGLVVLALALLFGGYVAGRVARYAGLRNGLLAAVAFLLLTAALSALASSTDEAQRLELPSWLDQGTATIGAIIATVVALLVILGGGALGGHLGRRWHRNVDDVLLGTRPGAVAPYPERVGVQGESAPARTTPRSAAPKKKKTARR